MAVIEFFISISLKFTPRNQIFYLLTLKGKRKKGEREEFLPLLLLLEASFIDFFLLLVEDVRLRAGIGNINIMEI